MITQTKYLSCLLNADQLYPCCLLPASSAVKHWMVFVLRSVGCCPGPVCASSAVILVLPVATLNTATNYCEAFGYFGDFNFFSAFIYFWSAVSDVQSTADVKIMLKETAKEMVKGQWWWQPSRTTTTSAQLSHSLFLSPSTPNGQSILDWFPQSNCYFITMHASA